MSSVDGSSDSIEKSRVDPAGPVRYEIDGAHDDVDNGPATIFSNKWKRKLQQVVTKQDRAKVTKDDRRPAREWTEGTLCQGGPKLSFHVPRLN